MDFKSVHHTTEKKNILSVCDSCGAENTVHVENCPYCGKTLVTITEIKTEDRGMSPDEMLRKGVEAANKAPEMLSDFTEDVKKFNEEWKRSHPNYSSNSEENQKKFYIGLVVLILTIPIIGAIFMIFMMLLSYVPMIIASQTNIPEEAIGGVITIITLLVEGLCGLGFLAVVGGIIALTVRRKTTKTEYKKQCPACGATNPAGAKVCGYCGHSLVESTTFESATVAETAGKAGVDALKEVLERKYESENPE